MTKGNSLSTVDIESISRDFTIRFEWGAVEAEIGGAEVIFTGKSDDDDTPASVVSFDATAFDDIVRAYILMRGDDFLA